MIGRSITASELWKSFKWKKFQKILFRLQKRVYKAVRVGDRRKARSLQKLILKSQAARLLAIRQVTPDWLYMPTSIGSIDRYQTFAGGLLSISQFVPSLFAYLQDRTQEIAYILAIGVACASIFQIFFSQIDIINPLFNTQPLSAIEALIAISVGLPIIIPALLLKRFAPFT